jgi:hypothetical protein
MNKKKKEILESKGYKIGSVDEFFGSEQRRIAIH